MSHFHPIHITSVAENDHHFLAHSSPDIRYPLHLRGHVDQLYRYESDHDLTTKNENENKNGNEENKIQSSCMSPIMERNKTRPFEFNQEVVQVFDDMVSRSVPLYMEVTDLVLYWVQKYYQYGTHIYDLGCSTGTTLDVLIRSFLSCRDSNDRMVNGEEEVEEEFVQQEDETKARSKHCVSLIGVDNSPAMVQACRDKLEWVQEYNRTHPQELDQQHQQQQQQLRPEIQPEPIHVEIHCADIVQFPIQNTSFIVMNYTLQFIPPNQRHHLLQSIYHGLCQGGVLFLSEKVRAEDQDLQDTLTFIYEDFKKRRGYTKTEIERKKEALMNVLIPYTEQELRQVLLWVGFHSKDIEIIAKWNNFTTFVVRKNLHPMNPRDEGMIASSHSALANDDDDDVQNMHTKKNSHAVTSNCMKEMNPINSIDDMDPQKDSMSQIVPSSSVTARITTSARGTPLVNHLTVSDSTKTPYLDRLLFDEDYPFYLSDSLDTQNIMSLHLKRIEAFRQKGEVSLNTLVKYDKVASLLLQLPPMKSNRFIFHTNELTIGDPDELTLEQRQLWCECAQNLRPWKKGPLNLFGISIDTEWRSDWKWARFQPSLPNLKDMVIGDIGCGNGYYMFRMLEYEPKLVIGIDPNIHAYLEFKALQRFSGVNNIHFEFLRADCLTLLPALFDVVFCLGVLYHTNDPIGMLRDIWNSMKPGGYLFIDCQGISIEGDDPVALFPQKRYANMRGVYFLPTLNALKNWIHRANFLDIAIIFAESLSVTEQRITEWAPVHTSLKESLNCTDPTKTIEGYPAPYRFYVKCRKVGRS